MPEIIIDDPLVLGAFLAACFVAVGAGLLLLADVLSGHLESEDDR